MIRSSIILLTSIFLASPALSASFDCTRELTPVEKLICSDSQLSADDERVNRRYRAQIINPKIPFSETRATQRAWIKSRNRCQTKACLLNVYKKRIDAMEKHGELFHVPLATFSHLGSYHEDIMASNPPATITFKGCGGQVCLDFEWITQSSIQQNSFHLYTKRDTIYGISISPYGRCVVEVNLQSRYVLLKDVDTDNCERPIYSRDLRGLYIEVKKG